MSENKLKNQENTNTKKCAERRIKSTHTETSAEYILPDYMGDIKRILKSTATLLPAGQYADGGEVSFSGIVTYKVLYVDGDGIMTEASFSSDYEFSGAVGEGFEGAMADSELGGVHVRPTGPRKLSAKATVISDIYICEEMEIASPENCEKAEKNIKTVNVHGAEYFSSGEREYAEEAVTLEGVRYEEVEAVSSSGKARVDDVKIVGGCVRILGELELEAILCVSADAIVRVEKKIPFEETLEGDVRDGCAGAMAFGYVTSVNVGINDMESDGDGFGTSVVLSAIAEFKAKTDYNVSQELICDAFGTDRKTDAEYRDFCYDEHICNSTYKKKISFERDRESLGAQNFNTIISKEASPKRICAKASGGNIIIEGEIGFSVVATANEKGEYTPFKCAYSFEDLIKCDREIPDGCEIDLHVYVGEESVVADGADVAFGCSIVCFLSVIESKRKLVLSALKDTDDVSCGCVSVVTVYYPDKSESLWDVAKKYSVSPVAIAEENKLSADCVSSPDSPSALAGVKRLFIHKM